MKWTEIINLCISILKKDPLPIPGEDPVTRRDQRRKFLMECYKSNPSPQTQAENCCGDCPWTKDCLNESK